MPVDEGGNRFGESLWLLGLYRVSCFREGLHLRGRLIRLGISGAFRGAGVVHR